MQAILEKNRYSVDVVFDGGEALAFLQSGQYDGAILDIMMPVMDGVTVLKKIRAQGSRLPILLLTARSEVEDKVTGLDSTLALLRDGGGAFPKFQEFHGGPGSPAKKQLPP